MTKTSRRPPQRTNDPDGTRRKLLDAAASLFQSHGYHATSMHDLMAAAGVSAGALYHHFPTKKAFGVAVIRERVAAAVAETWIAPLADAATAQSGLAAVFRAIASELDAAGSVRGCPLNNLTLELSLADPDFRGEIQKVFADWQSAVAAKLRAERAAGRLKHIDAEKFATFVVSAYSGAMAIAKAEQNSRALKICAQQLSALLKPE